MVISFQYLPTLFFGAYGGVFIDAFDKRKVMAFTQVVQALVALLLALLTFTDVIQLWMVYAIVVLNGFALVVDNPARTTIVSELVGDDDFPNAVGLNNATMQTARIAGPAIAGPVIVLFGTAVCFAVNSLSFVAMLIALAMMRGSEMRRRPPIGRHKGQMRDGLRYIWRKRDLRCPADRGGGGHAVVQHERDHTLTRWSSPGCGHTEPMVIALGCGALVGALAPRPGRRSPPMVFGVGLRRVSRWPRSFVPCRVLRAAVIGATQTTFITSSIHYPATLRSGDAGSGDGRTTSPCSGPPQSVAHSSGGSASNGAAMGARPGGGRVFWRWRSSAPCSSVHATAPRHVRRSTVPTATTW
jgi:hypothetical protein